MLGTWTRGGRMEGADESTMLWRHPTAVFYVFLRLESEGSPSCLAVWLIATTTQQSSDFNHLKWGPWLVIKQSQIEWRLKYANQAIINVSKSFITWPLDAI